MGEYKLRFESKSEHCMFCWDEVNKTWVKLIIEKAEKLPDDVEEQIQKEKEKALLLLEAVNG